MIKIFNILCSLLYKKKLNNTLDNEIIYEDIVNNNNKYSSFFSSIPKIDS